MIIYTVYFLLLLFTFHVDSVYTWLLLDVLLVNYVMYMYCGFYLNEFVWFDLILLSCKIVSGLSRYRYVSFDEGRTKLNFWNRQFS